MEMQTKDARYSCVQCNLSFKMTKDLKTHMIQHDGKKPHSCNQCNYSSIKAADLRKHLLVHSGEKPFVCKQCNFSCTSAGTLKTHMLTHSGEKPFSCMQCEFSCTTASWVGVGGNSRNTCWSTQEKNLSVAHNATTPAPDTRYICSELKELEPLLGRHGH